MKRFLTLALFLLCFDTFGRSGGNTPGAMMEAFARQIPTQCPIPINNFDRCSVGTLGSAQINCQNFILSARGNVGTAPNVSADIIAGSAAEPALKSSGRPAAKYTVSRSDLNFRRKPASGSDPNYALLFITGSDAAPSPKAVLNMSVVAKPGKLNFKLHKAFRTLLGGHARSAQLRLEVLDGTQSVMASKLFNAPCPEVGRYTPMISATGASTGLVYPADEIPVFNVCSYDKTAQVGENSVSLPPSLVGKQITLRWTLEGNNFFNTAASFNCGADNQGRQRCSSFTPAAYISIDDVGFEAAPVVARLVPGIVTIFPPEHLACANNVTGYTIFRREGPSGDGIALNGGSIVGQGVMSTTGFSDNLRGTSDQPYYAVQPVMRDKKGPLSGWAQARWSPNNIGFTLARAPEENSPASFAVTVTPASSLSIPTGSSKGFVTVSGGSQESVKILAGASTLAEPNILSVAPANSSGAGPSTFSRTLSMNPAPLVGYPMGVLGLKPINPGELYSMPGQQILWVIAGNIIAQSYLSGAQILKVIERAKPGLEVLTLDNLKGCELALTGDQFPCKNTKPAVALGIAIPTPNPNLARGLKGFFLDMSRGSGLLAFGPAKAFLEQAAPQLFGTKTPLRFASCPLQLVGEQFQAVCGPNERAKFEAIASALATYEAAKMAQWRKDANKCLAGTGCGSFSRAEYFNRLEDKYLTNGIYEAGNIPEQSVRVIARSYAALLDGFTKPEQERLAQLEQQGSPWARLINDARLGFQSQLAFEQQSFNASWNTFVQELYHLQGPGGAAVKGLAMWVVQTASVGESLLIAGINSPLVMLKCPGGVMSLPVNLANPECRNALGDFLTNISNHDPFINTDQIDHLMTLNMDDPNDATNVGIYYTAVALPDLIGFVKGAVVVGANAVRNIPALLKRIKIPMIFKSPTIPTKQLTVAAGELVNQGNEVFAVVRATSDETKKILLEINEIRFNNVLSEPTKTELIQKLLRSGSDYLAQVRRIVSPNDGSELGRQLQAAQSQGEEAVKKAAMCSTEGHAAYKVETVELGVTQRPDNKIELAWKRMQAGNRLPQHPHPTDVQNYPQSWTDGADIVDTPATFTRVNSGTQFARIDNNFEELDEAVQYANDVYLIGGRGGPTSFQRSLWNHINNTPECEMRMTSEGNKGGRGSSVRPPGGWVSTTQGDNLDNAMNQFIFNSNRYVVVEEGATGANTIAYENNILDMLHEAEISFPNMIPAPDIQRVRIFDTHTKGWINVPRPTN